MERYSQPFYHIPRDYLNPPCQANVVVIFEEDALTVDESVRLS